MDSSCDGMASESAANSTSNPGIWRGPPTLSPMQPSVLAMGSVGSSRLGGAVNSLPLASVVSIHHDLNRPQVGPLSSVVIPRSSKGKENHSNCSMTEAYANASINSFNEMAEDVRRTFMTWFNSIEMELCSQWDALRRERADFEEERIQESQRLSIEREKEMEKIAHQRQKVQADQKVAVRQIAVERDESRRKLEEERKVFKEEMEKADTLLAREREDLRLQVATHEEEKQRVVDSSLAAQSMVEINVGGTVFESSKHTVSSQRGSFLDNLFAGKHNVVKDKNGRVFIDRDPESFRSILNFLRTPATLPCPHDECRGRQLIDEAKFYGIHFFPHPLVYVLGGNDGDNYISSVEMLDVANQTWSSVKNMMTPRAYSGSGTLGGRVYCFGGQNIDYKVMYDTEVFDVLRGDWFTAPTMGTPRRHHASVASGNRLYAIGGYDGSSIIDSVEVLDERLRTWNYVASLPTGRSAMQAVSCDNSVTGYPDIYVIGGTDGKRLDTVVRYDMRADCWESLPKNMMDVRSAGACVVHNEQLYALGGINGLHQINESIEKIDLSGRVTPEWSYAPNLLQSRLDMACTAIPETILVTGGQMENTVLDTVEFYRPELAAWQPGPKLNTARYAHRVEVCRI
eukprot:GHVH01004222.1.p1 GENE.GHVH01004222.1~~GHVH01004222.1.p1  ORF type:complete len:628 (+),score=101.89 GHVH01004222.1:2492-4375(+)